MTDRTQLIIRIGLTIALGIAVLTAVQGCGKKKNNNAQGVATDAPSSPRDEATDVAEDGHEHAGAHAEPTTYVEAVHAIHERMDSIADAFSENRLADIHEEAEEIAEVAGVIGKLSLASTSGVPREAVRTVNLTSKELVSICDTLHDAADEGERQAAEKAYARVIELVTTLNKYTGTEADHD